MIQTTTVSRHGQANGKGQYEFMSLVKGEGAILIKHTPRTLIVIDQHSFKLIGRTFP